MEWKRFAEGGSSAAFKRVVIWYGVMLVTGLSLAWLLGIHVNPELVVAGAVFFYVDVFGLDGGAVYGLAKVLGGKASFERHVGFISWWKLPVLVLQVLGLLLATAYVWGRVWYYAFIVAELAMFWITFRHIHGLNAWRSALLLAVLLTAMFPAFLGDGAVRELTNILAQG